MYIHMYNIYIMYIMIYIYIIIYVCNIYIIYIQMYIYIYIYTVVSFWSVKLHHKDKERYNIKKVFKQRKQLIWNLKFHADTAAIFSQMNETLNLQHHGIFCVI